MCRRFAEPVLENFDTEEEYLEELGYYEQEMMLREQMDIEDYYEQKYAIA